MSIVSDFTRIPESHKPQAIAELAVERDVGTVGWAARYKLPEPAPGRLPRLIHQIWIGPKPAPSRWMASWARMNPEWKYILWDNETLRTRRWMCQEQIDAMPEWNGKADIMRYEILYLFGGLCFDADSECIKPLDEHFRQHEAFACYENEAIFPGRIATGYLAAIPRSPLMKAAIDRIRRGLSGERAWVTVGPVFFTNLVEEIKPSIYIYPSRTFIPEHWNNDGAGGHVAAPSADVPTYARQFWGSTVGYPEETNSSSLGAVRSLPVISNMEAVGYVGTTPAEGLAQLNVLLRLGCRPGHRVLEIGCGALIAGYPLMQYLERRCYVGIDPNAWLVGQSLSMRQVADVVAEREARFVFRSDFRTDTQERFDFILSHSILSHTSNDQLTDFLRAVAEQLAPGGTAAASIRLAEGNVFGSTGSAQHGADFQTWQYPGVSWFQREDVIARAASFGLEARVEPNFTRVIVAAHPAAVHDWLVITKPASA